MKKFFLVLMVVVFCQSMAFAASDPFDKLSLDLKGKVDEFEHSRLYKINFIKDDKPVQMSVQQKKADLEAILVGISTQFENLEYIQNDYEISDSGCAVSTKEEIFELIGQDGFQGTDAWQDESKKALSKYIDQNGDNLVLANLHVASNYGDGDADAYHLFLIDLKNDEVTIITVVTYSE